MKTRSIMNVWMGIIISAVLLGCNHSLDLSQNAQLTLDTPVTGIVGGDEVQASDRVSQATVGLLIERNGFETVCTGTLIFKGIVLTAAHCVDESPTRVTIIFSRDMSSPDHSLLRLVDAQIIHMNWQRNRFVDRYDLALLHYQGTTPDGYQPVEPIHEEDLLQIGDRTIVAGYGRDSALSDDGIGTLRKKTAQILSAAGTTEIYLDGKVSGVCFGDSGGPAFVKRRDALYLWGISSAVTDEDCSGLATYTQVLAHGNWIVDGVIHLLRQ